MWQAASAATTLSSGSTVSGPTVPAGIAGPAAAEACTVTPLSNDHW
jgi:hypothetical protein